MACRVCDKVFDVLMEVSVAMSGLALISAFVEKSDFCFVFGDVICRGFV